MKYILLVLFTAFSMSLNAQMSPPTVTRSGNSLTQQDSYLTVAKRLGIPTSSTDDLDAAVTAQNSIKLLYNTTLQQLRLYNPVTMTWSSVSGGASLNPTNGLYLDGDSIKLGGNSTENTVISNPLKFSFRYGEKGNAINLDEPMPLEYRSFAKTYTGFDYTDSTLVFRSFSGILKRVVLPLLDLDSVDIIGTLVITGNPFDSLNPIGDIFIDGIWDDGTGAIKNSIVVTFYGANVTISSSSQFSNYQAKIITGNDVVQTQEINGNNSGQLQGINGDNATQGVSIVGDNANQYQVMQGQNGIIKREINNTYASKKFTETITDTKQIIEVDNIELKSDVEIEGSLTNHDGSYYVKSTDLPKKLINFSGDVTTLVGAADPETTIFSYKITPDMWKTMSAYELSILGSFQAAATQNQTLSLYMNTTNSIGGSKLWNGYITTNTVASPFGGSVLAIEKKLWKDSNIIITEGGNTTVTTTNSNTNFDSGVYNNVLQKYLIESTLDFTNDIWLILTTNAGISSGTLKIKKLLLREI